MCHTLFAVNPVLFLSGQRYRFRLFLTNNGMKKGHFKRRRIDERGTKGISVLKIGMKCEEKMPVFRESSLSFFGYSKYEVESSAFLNEKKKLIS